jgi:group I intron endonuclease
MNLQLLIEMMDNSVTNKEFGHWEIMPYLLDQDPLKAHGFVYCVENTKTGKLYIGRKQTVHLGKKSSKTYGKTTNWKSYMGSSKHLTDDIKSLGKDKFKFVILEFYNTRGGLNYAEIAFQIKCDVMTAKLPDGERQFYNGQVGAVRWIPKEFHTEETRAKMSADRKGKREGPDNPMYGRQHSDETKAAMSSQRQGTDHPWFKGLVVGTNIKTKETVTFEGTRIMRECGFCDSHISACLTGKRKTHKGYTWKRRITNA